MTDLLPLVVGFVLGCPLWAAVWFAVFRKRQPRWPRFARDLGGPVLSGASDRFFRKDYSDTRSL